jgi:[ribosomal protein S5]-alanine N-acetyltransferase
MRRLADLVIDTTRLRLRPVAQADAPALFAIFSDPVVMRYWSTPPWTAPTQAEEMVRRESAGAAAGSSVRLAVLVRAGAAVGAGTGVGAPQSGPRAGSAQAGPPAASAGPPAELIGTVSLFALDLGNRRAEIGYALHRSAWGHGYAAEAVTGVVDHAFGELGLNRLEADIDPRNEASARLLDRLGFRREGLLRERWIVAGEVSDSALYGLLRSDRG